MNTTLTATATIEYGPPGPCFLGVHILSDTCS